MKKFLFLLVLLSAFAALSEARAGILIGTLSPIVTSQTNTPTFQTNTAYVSLPQITVSNGAMAISNAYTGSFRFSIDNGTTWFTNNSAQFQPTTNAAASYVIAAQTVQIPIQVQMTAITNVTGANNVQITLGVTSP